MFDTIYHRANYPLRLLRTLGICVALIVCGCSGGTLIGNPENSTFKSEAELERYIKGQFAGSVLDQTLNYESFSSGPGLDASGDAMNDGSDGSGDFSQTNIQEAGVDEGDKVKNDGEYLYVAGNRSVNIVLAVPHDEMDTVATIDVNGSVDALYLFENHLIILYTPNDYSGDQWIDSLDDPSASEPLIGLPYWVPVEVKTGTLIVDVGDPTSPETLRSLETEGQLVSSRLIDGKLHIIQQFLPDMPPLELWCDGSSCDSVISRNESALEDLSLDDLIPSYTLFDNTGTETQSGRLVDVDGFYRPVYSEGGSIVTITSFDLNNPSAGFDSIGILGDAHTVYASTQSLYLATAIWERTQYSGDYRTILHKFDIQSEPVSHVGSGRVSGTIINQFSLGEYEDVIRIATTTVDSTNKIYCLKSENDRLSIIGKIEGLAPGESIYAARFIGPRGYLVTFVKVDPLFTLDLSDPENPSVVGELKVPGYSDYIHPLGENHLLTIGKDTTVEDDMVYFQGVQLSIFDITEFDNPTLLHKEVIGDRGTDSEALYNHKAFTFWTTNDLLAIPVTLYNSGTYSGSGLYVYQATTEEGFVFLGQLPTNEDTGSYSYYWDSWTRGTFIGDSVYAIQSDQVIGALWDDIGAGTEILSLP